MFQPMIRRFIEWRERRIAIYRLRNLDDRLLNDLGTQREDIVRFVSAIDQCRQ